MAENQRVDGIDDAIETYMKYIINQILCCMASIINKKLKQQSEQILQVLEVNYLWNTYSGKNIQKGSITE